MKRVIVLLMAMIGAALLSSSAFAQVYPFPTQSGASSVAATIAAGGGTSAGITGGVEIRATGTATVTALNGTRIAVPTAATATVGKAALAKAAARLVGGASILGAAYQTYEVYNWIKNSGIQTCPPPDFFCKPGSDPYAPSVSWRYDFDTINGGGGGTAYVACQGAISAMQSWYAGRGETTIKVSMKDAPNAANGHDCVAAVTNGALYNVTQSMNNKSSCTNGQTFNRFSVTPCGGTLQPGTVGGPYTQQELESGLIGEGTNWDPSRSQAMRDAILADNAKQKILTPGDITPPASPLKYDPVPATSANPIVTKTETFKNPDGSTTTRTTTETTSVNPAPAPAPGTVASPITPKYETSTKTEVQDRNDATGVVTPVSTTVTNSVPAQAEPPKLEIPDDYARENTLQNIERNLNTDSAKEMPDQDKRVADAAQKQTDDLKALRDAVASAQNADKSLWFSWVWTPPVGECQPGKAVLTGGALVAWDICPTVNNIKGVLGWLMALFGAWSIYGEIFRRND